MGIDTYVNRLDFVPGPGGRLLRKKAPVGAFPPTPTPTPMQDDVDYGIIWLTPHTGFNRNNSGNPILDYDLGTENANFSKIIAALYPCDSGDDNDIQWEVPVPQDMDLTDPQITATVHILIPDPATIPTSCAWSFMVYDGSGWIQAVFTFDASGNLISDGAGTPVMVPC